MLAGVLFWHFGRRSTLAWTVLCVAFWFVAVLQSASSGAHFGVSVGASDLCPILQRVKDGQPIEQLPERERKIVDALIHCNDAQQLFPLSAAVALLVQQTKLQLKAAESQPFVDLKVVEELTKLVALGESIFDRLDMLESCKSATDAMSALAPLICEGVMFHSFYLMLTTACMALASTVAMSIAVGKRRILRRGAYFKFDSNKKCLFYATSDSESDAFQPTEADLLVQHERHSSYGSTQPLLYS